MTKWQNHSFHSLVENEWRTYFATAYCTLNSCTLQLVVVYSKMLTSLSIFDFTDSLPNKHSRPAFIDASVALSLFRTPFIRQFIMLKVQRANNTDFQLRGGTKRQGIIALRRSSNFRGPIWVSNQFFYMRTCIGWTERKGSVLGCRFCRRIWVFSWWFFGQFFFNWQLIKKSNSSKMWSALGPLVK